MSRPTLAQKLFSVVMTALMVVTYNPLVAVAAEWVQPEPTGLESQPIDIIDGEAVLDEDATGSTTGDGAEADDEDAGASVPVDEAGDAQPETDGPANGTESVGPMDSDLSSTLWVSGGTRGVDWEYEKDTDTFVIKTPTQISFGRVNAYYKGKTSTIKIDTDGEDANLVFQSIYINDSDISGQVLKELYLAPYKYQKAIDAGESVQKSDFFTREEASIPTGKPGIEITPTSGDVTLTFNGDKPLVSSYNGIWGGPDCPGIEKPQAHEGTLRLVANNQIWVGSGLGWWEKEKGPAAIGSRAGQDTKNIIATSNGDGKLTATSCTWIDDHTSDYGAAIGAGSGGKVTNLQVIANDNAQVSAQAGMAAGYGAGYGSTGESDIHFSGTGVAFGSSFLSSGRGCAVGVSFDDSATAKATVETSVGKLWLQAGSYAAVNCGTEGTFTHKGGYLDLYSAATCNQYNTDHERMWALQAKKVVIDAGPNDTVDPNTGKGTDIGYIRSDTSYGIVADEVEIGNGDIMVEGGALYGWWNRSQAIVTNKLTVTGGSPCVLFGGVLLAKNGPTLSSNTPFFSIDRAPAYTQTGGYVYADTARDANSNKHCFAIDVDDNCLSGSSINVPSGTLDVLGGVKAQDINVGVPSNGVSDLANARLLSTTGQNIGEQRESILRPAINGHTTIGGGRVAAYVDRDKTGNMPQALTGDTVAESAFRAKPSTAVVEADGIVVPEELNERLGKSHRSEMGEVGSASNIGTQSLGNYQAFSSVPEFYGSYKHITRGDDMALTNDFYNITYDDEGYEIKTWDETKEVFVPEINDDEIPDCNLVLIRPSTTIAFDSKDATYTTTYSADAYPLVFAAHSIDASGVPINYQSTDERVATVDSKGNVTIKGVGTTKIQAWPSGIYGGAMITCELTVDKGTPSCDVTIDESWTFGESAPEPVPSSITNGIEGVEFSYQRLESGSPVGTSSQECPTDAGTYRVTATFPTNDLYREGTAHADFTIEKAQGTIEPIESKMLVVRSGGTQTLAVDAEGAADLSATISPDIADVTVEKSGASIASLFGLTQDEPDFLLKVTPKAEGTQATITLTADSDANHLPFDQRTVELEVKDEFATVKKPDTGTSHTLEYRPTPQNGLVLAEGTENLVNVKGDLKATEPGTYTTTVEPKSGYVWEGTNDRSPVTVQWTIGKFDISHNHDGLTVSISKAKITYNGETKTPTVTIEHDGKPVDMAGFEVSGGGVDAASHPVTISAKPDNPYYQGNQSGTFTISPATITDANSGGDYRISVNDFTYNGQPATPTASVTAPDGRVLEQGRDFTVSSTQRDVTASGASTYATVTGRGNYTGSVAYCNFKIVPASLNDLLLKGLTDLSSRDIVNGQGARHPQNTIKLVDANGQEIPSSNYKITYADNANVTDQAKLIITPVQVGKVTNLTDGPKEYKFRIVSGDVRNTAIDVPTGKTLVFNNTQQYGVEGNVGYRLVHMTGSQYLFASTHPGDYTALVEPNPGYCWSDGSVSQRAVPWKIVKADLADASPVLIEDAVYDGTAKCPKFNLKIGDWTVDSTYYRFVYSNNTNAGTASVTCEAVTDPYYGKDIEGSKTFTFTIERQESVLSVPETVDISAFDERLVKQDVIPEYNGDGTLSATSQNENVVTVKPHWVMKKQQLVQAIEVLPTGMGTTLVRVKASQGENFTAAEASFYVTVTATSNGKILVDIPTPASYVFDGNEHYGVSVPTGAVTVSGDQKATDAGEYTAELTLNEGYAWAKPANWSDSDGAFDANSPREVTWSIRQADGILTTDASDMVLDASGHDGSDTFSGTVKFNGKSKPVATVSGDRVTATIGDAAEDKPDEYPLTITAQEEGTALVTLTGANDQNVTDATATFYVSVIDSGMDSSVVNAPTAAANLVYNGREQVGVARGDGYTLEGPSVPTTGANAGSSVGTNAGTYQVTAKVDTEHTWDVYDDVSPKSYSWTIAPADLSSARLEGVVSRSLLKDANGEVLPCTQEGVKVILADGAIVPESEYELVYEGNDRAGQATIRAKARSGRNVTGETAPVAFTVSGPSVAQAIHAALATAFSPLSLYPEDQVTSANRNAVARATAATRILTPEAVTATAMQLSLAEAEAQAFVEEHQQEEVPGEVLVSYDSSVEVPGAEEASTAPTEEAGAAAITIGIDESVPTVNVESAELIVESDDEPGVADTDVVLVQLEDEADTDAFIEEMNARPGITAQPNYRYTLMDEIPAESLTGALQNAIASTVDAQGSTDADAGYGVNDTDAEFQYHLGPYSQTGWTQPGDPPAGTPMSGANVAQAWNERGYKNSDDVTIAVIDTGCMTSHEDLQDNVDLENARDIFNETSEPGRVWDPDGHGTHVCGIAAAVTNNNLGVAGTSFNAKVLPLKVFDDQGESAYTSDIVKAYDYLCELIEAKKVENLRVINMSLGGYGEDPEDRLFRTAIEKIRDDYGVLTLAAGGNGINGMPQRQTCLPSDFDCVFSVTSIDQYGNDSYFADFNESKDISAPGENILSTIKNSNSDRKYGEMTGSSMATPLVAGICAMLFSDVPQAYPDDVITAIRATANPTHNPNVVSSEYREKKQGSPGIVDAARALEELRDMLGTGNYKYMRDCSVDMETEMDWADGEALKALKSVSYEGDALVQDRDYTVTYENNTDPGTATMVITGLNEYHGTIRKHFRIACNLEKRGSISAIPPQRRTGDTVEPVPQVRFESRVLRPAIDYTLSYQRNVEPGQATLTVNGIGDYRGTLTQTFQIVSGAGSEIEAPVGLTLTYNGQAQMGVPVSESGVYTVEGNVATNAGTHTAKVTPTAGFAWIGGDTETKDVTWVIEPAAPTLRVPQRSYEFKLGNYGAYDIPLAFASDATGDLEVTSSRGDVASVSYDRTNHTIEVVPSATGSTTVTVKAPAGTNYTSGSMEFNVAIVNGDAGSQPQAKTVGVPKGATLPYTGGTQIGVLAGDCYTLSPITGNCEIQGGNAIATNAGTYEVSATLAPGYQWADAVGGDAQTVSFEIVPATANRLDIGAIGSFVYDGEDQTPVPAVKFRGTALNAGSDFSIAYANNRDSGTGQANLTFGGPNGNFTGSLMAEFAIGKATPTITITGLRSGETISLEKGSSSQAYTVNGVDGSETVTSGSPNVELDYNRSTHQLKVTGKDVCTGVPVTVSRAADENHNEASFGFKVTVTDPTPSNPDDNTGGTTPPPGGGGGGGFGGGGGGGGGGGAAPTPPAEQPATDAEQVQRETVSKDTQADVNEDAGDVAEVEAKASTGGTADSSSDVIWTVTIQDEGAPVGKVADGPVAGIVKALKNTKATKAELVGGTLSIILKNASQRKIEEFCQQCIDEVLKGAPRAQAEDSVAGDLVDASFQLKITCADGTSAIHTVRFQSQSQQPSTPQPPTTPTSSVTVYRLYNQWSGEHLFTTSLNEYRSNGAAGWTQEGVAWSSPASSKTPVYRLYNPNSGDHHYTTSFNEYNTLGGYGWNREGVAWYSDDAQGKPVYRLFNQYVTIGTHHFTTDASEYANLPAAGWKQEDIGWYGLK